MDGTESVTLEMRVATHVEVLPMTVYLRSTRGFKVLIWIAEVFRMYKDQVGCIDATFRLEAHASWSRLQTLGSGYYDHEFSSLGLLKLYSSDMFERDSKKFYEKKK